MEYDLSTSVKKVELKLYFWDYKMIITFGMGYIEHNYSTSSPLRWVWIRCQTQISDVICYSIVMVSIRVILSRRGPSHTGT